MRNRVERLRIWLLGSAIFLMLVIAGFLGSAHYLRQRLRGYLPAKLGANVKIDSTGVTWSHTQQGKTVYEIHAAKEIEHTNGVIGLHDVWIALYGPKGDRADRICGADFEYDQNAQLVRATGPVHIDLQSAPWTGSEAGASGNQAGAAAAAGGCPSQDQASGPKVLHVTTSGLVFMQKLGLAATGAPIEFQIGGLTGHAVGADYNSDSGVLMLHSAVSMSGVEGGRPVAMTAATAELDNLNHEAFLTHATYESEGRRAQAEQATLHSRPDGTLARIEAQGDATATVDGRTMVSQRADVALNGSSQPQLAVLTGGVRYWSDEPLRQVRGQADGGTIGFDQQEKPQPEHAVFTGAVHMTERTRASDAAREPWSTRDLTAAKFEAELVPAGPGKSQLRDAEATGGARLTMVDNGSLARARGEGATELSGDDLKAHLIDTGDAKQPPQLDTVAARGHTVLHRTGADGVDQTSAGDTLDAKFKPRAALGGKGAAAASDAGRQIADTLWSAVQQGHVTMTRRAPAKSGSGSKQNEAAGQAGREDVEHAIAERAVYDGDRDQVALTGGVELSEPGSVLWASQVALDRATGDVQAMGGVKVDYVQDASTQGGGGRVGAGQAGVAINPTHDGGAVMNGAPAGATAVNGASAGAGEPTHILADRADLEHASGIATFHGKPVRLWQGGNQVQAPAIEFSRAQKRLIARAEASTGWSGAVQPAQVHTVLMRAGGDGTAGVEAQPGAVARCGPAKAATGKSGAEQSQDVVRIASGGLVYSDLLRQADFTGGFRAATVDGTIRASQATVYLQPGGAEQEGSAGSAKSVPPVDPADAEAGAVPSLTGHVDRIVATGQVAIEQPGLRATGERLVYTASDQAGVLTGERGAPPRATDAQGTTTTGAALRFQNSCEAGGGVSVEALGEVPGAPAQRVRTESRVRNEGKKEKGKQ